MSEEKVQDTAQELTTESQKEELNISPDVGEAIAESKKYRARAQKAETEVEILAKKIEEIRTKQLEEQNDYKTLADERKAIIAEQNAELEITRAEIKTEVEALLSDFSDNDRETFEELSLKQLRAVHSKLTTTSKVPNVNHSNPTMNSAPIGDWTKLDSKEKRDNWQGIMDSFKKK